MTLSEKIYQCRKDLGKSQEALAFDLGVSRQAVSKWETGESEPDISRIRSLARVFGVSIDWLLSEDGPETLERVIPVSEPIDFGPSDGYVPPVGEETKRTSTLDAVRYAAVFFIIVGIVLMWIGVGKSFTWRSVETAVPTPAPLTAQAESPASEKPPVDYGVSIEALDRVEAVEAAPVEEVSYYSFDEEEVTANAYRPRGRKLFFSGCIVLGLGGLGAGLCFRAAVKKRAKDRS